MKLALSRRLATAGTVALTTVAVAFAGTPANAADSSSYSTSGARVSASAETPVTVSSVRVSNALLERSGTTTSVRVSYAFASNVASVSGATADVYVNGAKRTRINLPASGRITFARTAGFGKAYLRNITFRGTYNTGVGFTYVVPTWSNTFLIRRTIDPSARLAMRKSGSKIRATGTRWRAVQPNGTWIRVPQVIVQKRSGGKWRTVKTVRPNSKGGFSFSFRSSKKVYYRALVKTTSTLAGGATRSFRI
jgi:hypothetical protein